jgi:prolyl-tRNA synthetase
MGQNFSKAFNIQFTNKENQLEYAYTTSWGVTTRLIGALIMVHGDDKGLMVPPQIAPTQLVIVTIGKNEEREEVLQFTNQVQEDLKAQNIRVKVDARENYSPGWKFNEYELKGIPIRLEVGPRDLKEGQVILARRDTGEKIKVPVSEITKTIHSLLENIQSNLFESAKNRYEENSHIVDTIEELSTIIQDRRGFVLAGWCGARECEQKVQEVCGATSRNIPFEIPKKLSECVTCGQEAKHTVWFAKAY